MVISLSLSYITQPSVSSAVSQFVLLKTKIVCRSLYGSVEKLKRHRSVDKCVCLSMAVNITFKEFLRDKHTCRHVANEKPSRSNTCLSLSLLQELKSAFA